MKYTIPPEGHRWHLPQGVPTPEGWRHCLEAEIHEGQSWSSKRVRCRRWDTLEKDWTTTEDWGGNLPLSEYIVPDTTPFDIPEGFDEEGEISQEEAFRHIPPRPATRMAKDMTLREHYAGMAMQGLTSIPDDRTWKDNGSDGTLEEWRVKIYRLDAEHCVKMADALIAALNQKEETK
jgi:hypothetical protein